MGIFSAFYSPWSFLVIALAIIHFIRRRPDTYWLYIILFLGPLGATIYLLVEALPDVGLLRQSFKAFPRRRRIHELEAAVLDNPSAGNYEELADLFMEDGNFSKARACYDKAISSRTDSPDPFYRRGVCEVELGISCRPFRIWSALWAMTKATIFTAPKDCWRTPTRIPDKRRRPRSSSGK